MAANSSNNNKDLGKRALDECNAQDTDKSPPITAPTLIENSQSLVDIANNTFKELCRTLENEQTKLLELEERRKKLQEEMQRLKLEIEEEKHTYRLNLVESLSENANTLCANGITKSDIEEIMEIDEESELELVQQAQTDLQNKLYTCYEDEEANDKSESAVDDTDDSKHPREVAQNIQKKLQGVVAECIIGQVKYDEHPDEEQLHTAKEN